MGKNEFSYELTFISIENSGKQESKIHWKKKSINSAMVNAISLEYLMPSTKYKGLSYPTNLLKSRSSIIRNTS